MSRFLVVLALFVSAALAYDEKYDSIDTDKIIADDQLFSAYVDCLLDKGPCSVEHSEDFRKILPEVIDTACEKCTPIQRQKVRKSVKAIQEKKPTEFVEFQEKYDPKGEKLDKFAAFLLASD